MTNSVMLTITSLLLVLLLTFHLADDIRRGFEPGGLSNLVGGVLITVVWLYGILVLAERRSGYIIMFLLSLFSLVVPYVHMKGRGVGVTSRIANSSGHPGNRGKQAVRFPRFPRSGRFHDLCRREFSFGAPTARAKLQNVPVMKQPIELGTHRWRITQQFAPIFDWAGSSV
jgi:hypothetical protein